MNRRLRFLNSRHPWLTLSLILGFGAVAAAGIRGRGVHQFPAPDFTHRTDPTVIESVTATRTPVLSRSWPHAIYLQAVQAVTRVMSGTITQATLQCYLVDQPMGTALDMYGTGLASAGTYREVDFNQFEPLFIEADTQLQCGMFVAGSNTPTLTDTTITLQYRMPVGQEQGTDE